MLDEIRKRFPKTKKPNLGQWADTIRLMREQDGHTINEIRRVFLWAMADEFWWKNIRSPAKLREQFARLHGQMQNEAPLEPSRPLKQPKKRVAAVTPPGVTP